MINEMTMKQVKDRLGFKRRKGIHVKQFKPGISLNSYWDGGSRDYFYFYNVKTGAMTSVPQNGTPFDGLDLKADKLEADQILVNLWVYGGKKASLTFYY